MVTQDLLARDNKVFMVQTVEAWRAPNDAVCMAGAVDYGSMDFSQRCGDPAVWVLQTTTVHGQPTPDQVRIARLREEYPDVSYPPPRPTQRRYRVRRSYCLGHVPSKHRNGGLRLWSRAD